jgi:SAM-dependent methyltransferase
MLMPGCVLAPTRWRAVAIRWQGRDVNASWIVDELAHAGREHLDPGFVAGYDRKQAYPAVDGDLEVLRDRGALTRHATVMDLGTGTGRFALAAAPHCARMVAVDVSSAMLEQVRRRAAAAGAFNVEVVQAGFLSYEHAGAPADAIYSRNALHQLPDFWKGIALHRAAGVPSKTGPTSTSAAGRRTR